MGLELMPHQQKAIDELENGNILYGGVGSGKTLTALSYYFSKVCGGVVGDKGSMRHPRDLFVITTAKKRDSADWEKDAAHLHLFREAELNPACVNFEVDSWNNIEKYENVKDAFFIFDEQRVVGSGKWSDKFIKIAKSNQWIVLSATPGDTWLDYIPVFVANGYYPNRSAFKREHVEYEPFVKFPRIKRYHGVNKLTKLRNHILVEMPFDRHTTRHDNWVEVSYDVELFRKVTVDRWHVYEERPLRDTAELFSVMRKVVNSDLSRLKSVEQLSLNHPKLIVFYNFDYELEILRTLGNTGAPTSPGSLGSQASISSPEKTAPAVDTNSPAFDCQGHWMEDRGEGELLLSCEEWMKLQARTQTGGTSPQRKSSSSSLAKSPTVSGSGLKSSSHGTITSDESEKYLDSNTKSPSGSTPYPNSTSSIETDKKSETFAIAEWNGHKHQEIPDTDRWIYLVQYVAGAEGWNCIDTNHVVFYSLTYSYKNFEQGKGRIDRLNTPYDDLYYHMLFSNSMIDKAVKKALTSKQNFNESAFGRSIGSPTFNN